MIRRRHIDLVRDRLRSYPAVSLVGPRQSGKTTLARSLGGLYFDMEMDEDRVRLDVDWDALVAGRRLVVLDEAQTWPDLFPRLRSAIDRDRKRAGRFLLLGSVSPALMRQVSESLAGRLGLVELSPFILGELKRVPLDRVWLTGGYPDGGVLRAAAFPRWQRDYLDLLAQRDLPAWGLPARPQSIQRMMSMLAAVHGQIWNASQIGSGLGLTHPTVNSYLEYLEGAFLVRRLAAYRANLKKRITKSPKVYWRDSGLLHAILNVPTFEELIRRPWVGASWEGFVITQAIETLNAAGIIFEPYYFRTSDEYEIDLVLELGRETWAIEAKLTSNPSPENLRRLNKAADLIGADRRILVSRTRNNVAGGKQASVSLRAFLDMLVAG